MEVVAFGVVGDLLRLHVAEEILLQLLRRRKVSALCRDVGERLFQVINGLA